MRECQEDNYAVTPAVFAAQIVDTNKQIFAALEEYKNSNA
jgi:hypothetical protein